ncbi:MAG: ClbS/DfsB family four-helix bundle protein [Candidatus Adiutrix sp.]|jgi:hypothetical protein|nr:ClbS/DfsB family four-helix bundle protein [Candidatus Adiutrix sp.]
MPRPATKADLLKEAEAQFEKMRQMLEAMPDKEQQAVFAFGAEMGQEAHWGRDKNLRDVLVHLYEWHQLLLTWIAANKSGGVQPFLPAPYNWKTYGAMNVGFWEKHQSTPYAEAKEMLLASHKKTIEVITSFSGDELFTKKHFSWTGTSTLGSYCVSATASHYDWAMKKIKAHRKTYQGSVQE